MIDRFSTVPTSDSTQSKIERIREAARQYEAALAANCPPGREQSLAVTNLEQATMWAVKAIAHGDYWRSTTPAAVQAPDALVKRREEK